MKNAPVLLLLMATPAAAHDLCWWSAARAEFAAELSAARATAPYTWCQLDANAEAERHLTNQHMAREYQERLPSPLTLPQYFAPVAPHR